MSLLSKKLNKIMRYTQVNRIRYPENRAWFI